MKHCFRYFTALFVLVIFAAMVVTAQTTFFKRNDSTVVMVNGDTLSMPWVGGLNNPQFWATDLNNDSILDLVIFDRGSVDYAYNLNGNKLLTFINHGTPNKVDYTYAPEYQQYFPGMLYYMVMADMNCDGVNDILSLSASGAIIMYLGHFDSLNRPYFTGPDTLQYNIATDPAYSPIIIPNNHIPAAIDVDGDGAVDILAFDNFANCYIYLYKNMSIAYTGNCADSIVFKLYDWDTSCVAGGNTICALDEYGNGLVDVIVSGNYSDFLSNHINAGTPNPDLANFIPPVDSTYPSYDTPVNIFEVPEAFFLDINNDGKKDLVVAPGIPPGPGGITSEDRSVWYYQNTSVTDTVHFHFQTDSFLVNQMLDMGEGAYPAFVDIDGDGLKDLVVGNMGYYVNPTTLTSKLEYFRNVGTNSKPAFQLMDHDFDSLSTVLVNGTPINGAAPAFGDMNGDSATDMIVGDATGQLQYFENTAGPGNPPVYTIHPAFAGINVGAYSVPFILDVNGDSLPDLIIGCHNGSVQYFQNRGTKTNPQFSSVPTNSYFGHIDVRIPGFLDGFSSPVITPLDSTGKLYVLVGCIQGSIYEYEFNADSISGGTFNLITTDFCGIHEGEYTNLAVGQLSNNGKYQMVTGNYRGGLSFYQGDSTVISGIAAVRPGNIQMEMFPNPAGKQVTLTWQLTGMQGTPAIEITDMLGRTVLFRQEAPNAGGNVIINVSGFAKGLYNCRLIVGDQYGTKKLMIQ